jgi:hypothetical protein
VLLLDREWGGGLSDRYNRVMAEEKRGPKFIYTPQRFILSYGKTAIYISVMGGLIYGVAPVEYVQFSFGESFC